MIRGDMAYAVAPFPTLLFPFLITQSVLLSELRNTNYVIILILDFLISHALAVFWD